MNYNNLFMWASVARNLGANNAAELLNSAEFRDGQGGDPASRRSIALSAISALKRTATVNVSVVTATLADGEFEPTGLSLKSAVEREIALIQQAGFEVVNARAVISAGDGGDYHSAGQTIQYGLPL